MQTHSTLSSPVPSHRTTFTRPEYSALPLHPQPPLAHPLTHLSAGHPPPPPTPGSASKKAKRNPTESDAINERTAIHAMKEHVKATGALAEMELAFNKSLARGPSRGECEW